MNEKFVSNVPLGTGTNYILEGKHHGKYRVFLPVELPGDFMWRISYINSVNSTFADGSVAFANREGGNFRIVSARIADGGVYGEPSPGFEPEWKEITFGGNSSYDVKPGEKLSGDPVRVNIPEGHSLAFEWELDGENIPCTPDSQAYAYEFTDSWKPAGNCPLPALFACDRPYKKRIAFLGDSITQGCGTSRGKVEMWAGRIAMMLPEYSTWNLGLGYARASDCATCGDWLYKAKQNDVVIVTLGVNDFYHGAFRAGRPSTAGETAAWVETVIKELKNSGVEVILSMIPPFDFTAPKFAEWRAFELATPSLAKMYGCRIYDIESSLDADPNLGGKYIYGSHPDGRGGLAAAEKFRETFYDKNKGEWTI